MSARRSQAAQPPAPRQRPGVTFAPGDRVRITGGLSAGVTAIVVAPWPAIGGVRAWRLDLPDAPNRVIREDFLEAAP